MLRRSGAGWVVFVTGTRLYAVRTFTLPAGMAESWVSSASDPGNNGPFDSAVYDVGALSLSSGRARLTLTRRRPWVPTRVEGIACQGTAGSGLRRREPRRRSDIKPVSAAECEGHGASGYGYDRGMTNDKSITVQRQIPVSAKAIFDVLSLPARHQELDGSGFVRGDDHTDRITGVGQTFRMNMTGEHMGGDYQTDNHVSGYDPDRLLSWKTAPADTDPPGWEWVWELKPESSDATNVSLTYDWSKVTDPDILAKVSFPLVSAKELDDSLNNLAAASSGS